MSLASPTKWFELLKFSKVSIPLREIDFGPFAQLALLTARMVEASGIVAPVSAPATVNAVNAEGRLRSMSAAE